MLTYRRKPGSGKLHQMSRDGGHKSRASSHKVISPGDTLTVQSENQLPGYPYSMEGWELIANPDTDATVQPARRGRPPRQQEATA
jgi:hypothetical protein